MPEPVRQYARTLHFALEGERIHTCPKCQIATGRARTAYRDNDTSVIRSPAGKKAGRFDSYGAASQAAA
ncbi:hypothetical protein [Enterocloster bolteae]|uniref:hypothetical protein n=1 Tax=Enterocloster bolteae TaxID=208479 RepID=UPI0029033217|nr:hypothetical protein [Enterocloster bolteae]MDU1139550.1 hypothetical protein [Enterocloster bolteae]